MHTHDTCTFTIDNDVARNSSSVAQMILSICRRPSSQSICQVVYLVCDPLAISTGPSLPLGLPQTGHFPTVVLC